MRSWETDGTIEVVDMVYSTWEEEYGHEWSNRRNEIIEVLANVVRECKAARSGKVNWKKEGF